MERNENGYSAFFARNAGDTERVRNGTCPGTGEIWRGGATDGNGLQMGDMSLEEFNLTHNACSKHQLAMVYSPHQCFRMLYDPDKALVRGTLFEELDKPLEDCTNG